MRPLATWCCNSRVESNMYSISLSALAKYVKYPKDIGFLFSEGHFSLSLYIYKKLLYKTTYICSWVLTFKKKWWLFKIGNETISLHIYSFLTIAYPCLKKLKKKIPLPPPKTSQQYLFIFFFFHWQLRYMRAEDFFPYQQCPRNIAWYPTAVP